jgi:hypothetical protein
MMDLQYHNECCCLFAEGVRDIKCIKRYYNVADYDNDEFKTIAICNELVRVKVREFIYRNGDNKHIQHYIASDIIESIIQENINIQSTVKRWQSSGNDLFDSKVYVLVVERPNIYRTFSLKEALDLYLNGNNMITPPLLDTVDSYLNNIIYKKYKNKYVDLIRIIKKLRKSYGEERTLLTTELFVNIHKLNIKNYETGKC